jgi:hypothetical protein
MLAGFNGFNPVTLGFVRRQLPAQEFPFLLPLSGIEPLAALGAAINAIPLRNPVFLIAPIVHWKKALPFLSGNGNGSS